MLVPGGLIIHKLPRIWSFSLLGTCPLSVSLSHQPLSVNVLCLGAQSCPTLCDPMDCSLPGYSVQDILQARILEWVTILFSREPSWPRDWTWVSCTVGRFFTIWATQKVGTSHCKHCVSLFCFLLACFWLFFIGIMQTAGFQLFKLFEFSPSTYEMYLTFFEKSKNSKRRYNCSKTANK